MLTLQLTCPEEAAQRYAIMCCSVTIAKPKPNANAKKMRGLVLKHCPLLLHYMNEVPYSTFFKLRVQNSLCETVVNTTLIADLAVELRYVKHPPALSNATPVTVSDS